LALAAVLLLLWCHGLDFAFMDYGTHVAPAAQSEAAAALAGPAPAQPGEPVVGCCPGGAGSGLLSATLTKLPQAATPVLAALLSAALFLAAFRPLRLLPQRPLPHRDSLVAQSVLIRI